MHTTIPTYKIFTKSAYGYMVCYGFFICTFQISSQLSPPLSFPQRWQQKSKVLKYVESASDLVILYIFMGNYNRVPLLQQEFAYFPSDIKHYRDKKCCDNDSFAACSSNPYYQLLSSNCAFITVK